MGAILAMLASAEGMAVARFVAKTGMKGVQFLQDISADGPDEATLIARWQEGVNKFDAGVEAWDKAGE